jgi:hypothetical protein
MGDRTPDRVSRPSGRGMSLEITQTGHKPSWKRTMPEDGRASLDVEVFKRGQVGFWARESYAGKGGKRIARETYIEIDDNAADQLVAFLTEVRQ